jgi:hypothetical protein
MADGTTYSSAECVWTEVPAEGVVGVVVYLDPPYRRIIDGHDWVWMEGGEFRIVGTHDQWGSWAPKPETSCGGCVKRGVGVPDDRWEAIQREMMEARAWPST